MSYSIRTLTRLELPKVLAQLEKLCACSLGRERVQTLLPETRPVFVRARLEETSQARAFLDMGRTPLFGGICDVASSVQLGSVGGILEADTLLKSARALEGMRRLRESIRAMGIDNAAEFSVLWDLSDGIFPRPDIEKAVFAAIDDDGQIKDDASLDLLRARRNKTQTQSQIQSRLRSMLGDSRVTSHLQDAFISVRDGRYCLPVKAESRGQVPGIVHDRSSSGNAVFIEPQAVVELNNRLRELESDERAAVEAILRSLSGLLGGARDEIVRSLDAAGHLDFAFAKAELSLSMRALEPRIESEKCGWNLKRARHPLVEGCVPNDLRLGDESAVTERGDFDVMMLTGPNTGGKTIVLKTLGLLTAMAACGLHLPVEETSHLSIPAQIHVDIGDEQSIEQSLSTFSGHLKNIVEILKTVRSNDLVLFDEIGAGTDPDEGAALAKAVLRALHRKGAKILATTHYGELKQFALSAMRFENASVEFDAITLAPTYHLRIGVPGASNALDIAARLGMPSEITARAKKYLGAEYVETEAVAQRLDETARLLKEQTDETRQARQEAERLRREYEKKLARIEQERERELTQARKEARALIEDAGREADATLRAIRKAGRDGENAQTNQARGRLRAVEERIKAGEKRPQLGVLPENDAPSPFDSAQSPLSPSLHVFKIGDIVRVRALDKEAEILKIEGKRAEIRVGAMRISAKLDELLPAKTTAPTSAGVASRKAFNVSDEINLIGKNVEEALQELEKYLDDALLAGLPEIRIVHGRGTGILRGAVGRFLIGQRAVKTWEFAPQNEGGDGATLVKLR